MTRVALIIWRWFWTSAAYLFCAMAIVPVALAAACQMIGGGIPDERGDDHEL
ncbi:MAG: hypothetical protein QM656_03415 [Paracoccaceae bacterium]